MTEPASTSAVSITALSIALLGPLAGPYALIVFAALAGSLWPISASDASSRLANAFLLLRCTLMAVIFTSVIAQWLQAQYQLQAIELLAPVAFVIGALGNGWRSVINLVADSLKTVINRISGAGGAGQ
jgi:hypothetical protein